MKKAQEPPPRYFTQAVVSLSTKGVVMIPPDQVSRTDVEPPEDVKALLDACHIYAIARRPAASFDDQNFSLKNGKLKTNLVWREQGNRKTTPLEVELKNEDGGPITLGAYPHRELIGHDATGIPTRGYAAFGFALHAHEPVLRDFEVVYVGLAYGEGNRSAMDRLRSHSTLQKILANILKNNPDDEVMLFLFSYDDYRIITKMDGMSAAAGAITGNKDELRINNIMRTRITEKKQIGLAEAALIRYFEPEYNEKYKALFPKRDQKVLDECYELDFDGLVVEIDTEDIPAFLYSKSKKSSGHHSAMYDLHNPTTRRSFFTMRMKDGTYGRLPGS